MVLADEPASPHGRELEHLSASGFAADVIAGRRQIQRPDPACNDD